MSRQKAFKIRSKNYHLVSADGSEMLTVFPPAKPGMGKDGKDPKGADGKWIRVFSIVDVNGVSAFAGQTEVVLTHDPRQAPSAEVNGVRWTVQPIPKAAKAAKSEVKQAEAGV